MKYENTVTYLVISVALLAVVAASLGIFSGGGPGPFEYLTVRGRTVGIYGRGLYQHMSAEVAPQGIAQDYVTLFIGIPSLLFALAWTRQGALKGRLLLAGILGYFLVTYLFYLVMGMYNYLFLVYAALLGTSFFAFTLTMLSFDLSNLATAFGADAPIRFGGNFLLFNTAAIAFLWLGIVIPPLLDGTVYPFALEHYTTLIVQGLDLGLLLPLAAVSGFLLRQKTPAGYLLGPVYLIFLTLLMIALTGKLIAMGLQGYNIIPPIIIIPSFALIAAFLSYRLLRSVRTTA